MSREIGDKFEEFVANSLGGKLTARSGAHWDDGDIKFDSGPLEDFVIECKYKSVPWLRPVKKEIQKLQKQAKKVLKEWLYVQGTEAGDFVVMDFNSFCELVRINKEAQEDSQKSYEALDRCVKEKNDAIKATNLLYNLLINTSDFNDDFIKSNEEKLTEIRRLLLGEA